ncbi:MAG: hypothetical protein JXB88_15215 [Spirochaetales bacterium]|nr:hypothetical protein [Spirochaetales bacterium]
MIVQMKKAAIFTLESHKKETLMQLRKLGVVHINPFSAESEELGVLLEKKLYFEKAMKLIPEKQVKEQGNVAKKDAASFARDIYTLHEQQMSSNENLNKLKQEYETLLPWGDFKPDTVWELRKKGVDLHFCVLQYKDIEKIPEEMEYTVLEKAKGEAKLIIIGDPIKLPFSYNELSLPANNLKEIEVMINEKENECQELGKKLASLVSGRQMIQDEITKLDREIEFEQIRTGMATSEQVAYLTGFVPVHSVENLKKKAKKYGWGLILDTPGKDDHVPTLLKNPRWISIIDPVFDLFGTIPGYHETDISFWFLLFFSLFFAMIIGDAGYGLCILLFTIIARINLKKAPAAPFILFTVMGIATVIWGAMTGTWFGIEQITRLPFFSWMIIDSIASFPAPGLESQVQQSYMYLCFTIAVIHLTIAHILHFIKHLPLLKAFADPGKILLLWGLYFLIQTVVFKKPMPEVTLWLIGIGFGINFIFVEQDGNFFKGLFSSVKNIIPIALNSISCFSDIISYVRLFAVGLATVRVAGAFNGMAAGVGFDSISIIGSVLILVFGHMLNMVMAGMSVMVHGVRLKMLEFSGHVELQWSGTKYKPFS